MDLDSLRPVLAAALDEDIGAGDLTTRLMVPDWARATGAIVVKVAGVAAGVDVALELFRMAARDDIAVTRVVEEGARVLPGETLLEIEGPAPVLLRVERTALNFCMRMCGVATLTAQFVERVSGTGARILDTRKTAPGLRRFDKAAVVAGGGENHRQGLYDAVLVKENHLAFGVALAEALAARPAGVPAICEAENLDEFQAAMDAGADVVLLDEFEPENVTAALKLRGDHDLPEIEVSGGITLDNVREYAEAGAERISIGALTHSAKSLDLSMSITPAPTR
ncbi:MAG: carboxylating nicotinate-nucleotide diphosphorylase [Planctomycetota bacterium]